MPFGRQFCGWREAESRRVDRREIGKGEHDVPGTLGHFSSASGSVLSKKARARASSTSRAADLPRVQHAQGRIARRPPRARVARCHARQLARSQSPSRRRRPRPPSPCCSVPSPRAPAPPRPSWSSARRTPSARRSPRPPPSCPCATADAMYSKCGVSPRMRQPRQTTASNAAAWRPRLRRQRNLEGARHADHRDVPVRRRRPRRARPARPPAADR